MDSQQQAGSAGREDVRVAVDAELPERIAAYVVRELRRTGRYPEVRAIAAALGVSRQTVGRHIAAAEKAVASALS